MPLKILSYERIIQEDQPDRISIYRLTYNRFAELVVSILDENAGAQSIAACTFMANIRIMKNLL